MRNAVHQNPALEDAGLGGGGAAVSSQERFQGLRIGTSWGKLLVLCLTESLNSGHPLLKVVIVMKDSLKSGDPAQ